MIVRFFLMLLLVFWFAGNRHAQSAEFPHGSVQMAALSAASRTDVAPFNFQKRAQILQFSGAPIVGAITDLYKPGPSTTLYNNPYYDCTSVTNYYVAIGGLDSRTTTQAQSSSTPWLTLQNASNKVTGPACIIVAHSASSYDGVQVIHGGTSATRTGWLAFRCDTLDGCKINSNAGPNTMAGVILGYCGQNTGLPGDTGTSAGSAGQTPAVAYTCPANTQLPSYVWFDGFEIVGPGLSGGSFGAGYSCQGKPTTTVTQGPHHCAFTNGIVHDNGETGIATEFAEYIYFVHNYSHDNTYVDSGGDQGSGLAINSEVLVSGYTPTTDDKTGLAPYLGFSTFVQGTNLFRAVIAYNVTALNRAPTGVAESDHSGIIIDSNNASQNPFGNYDQPVLVHGNVGYNNAGYCVNIFFSAGVSVSNNSCYNNGIMPNYGVSNIVDNTGGTTSAPDNFWNNIAVSCTTSASVITTSTPNGNNNASFQLAPVSGTDPESNNISNVIVTTGTTATTKCKYAFGGLFGTNGEWLNQTPDASDKLTTDPKWVSVSTASPGSDSAPPASTNFALASGSPAIGGGVVKSYMPSTAIDVGACPSSLTTCP